MVQVLDSRWAMPAGCMGLRSHLAGRSYHGTNSGVPRIKFSREGDVRYCTRSPGLISLIEVVVVFILVSLWALLLGSVLFNQLVA